MSCIASAAHAATTMAIPTSSAPVSAEVPAVMPMRVMAIVSISWKKNEPHDEPDDEEDDGRHKKHQQDAPHDLVQARQAPRPVRGFYERDLLVGREIGQALDLVRLQRL